MQAGIQVSSLKRYLRTTGEVRETFRRLSAMGYRAAQLQWIDRAVPAEAVRDALWESGLVCVATQDRYDDATQDFARTIRENRLWGSEIVCVSGIPGRYRSAEGVRAYGRELARRAEALREAGLRLAYHPLRADYGSFGEGTALARLMEALPEDVQITLDMYHLLRAGEDPVAWVSRCAGRMDMVHLKDCAGDGERLVPVGQGTTDWAPILSACRRSGVRWAMVEQESWEGDAFACMEQSLAYMRKMEVNP